jgi:hypothetical protein
MNIYSMNNIYSAQSHRLGGITQSPGWAYGTAFYGACLNWPANSSPPKIGSTITLVARAPMLPFHMRDLTGRVQVGMASMADMPRLYAEGLLPAAPRGWWERYGRMVRVAAADPASALTARCLLQVLCLRNLGDGAASVLGQRQDYGVSAGLDCLGRSSYAYSSVHRCCGTLTATGVGNIPVAECIADELARAAGGGARLRPGCPVTGNLRLHCPELDGELVNGEACEGVFSRAQHKEKSDRAKGSSGMSSTEGECTF